MTIQDKYTRIFKSDSMTRLKYDELHGFAVLLRQHRNDVSELVCANLLKYLEYSTFDFVSEMRATYDGAIPSSFDKHIYTQVLTCYQNKFKAVQKRLCFETNTFNGFERYKRKTKQHERGDLKKVAQNRKTTPLSTCLTYLARYGNDNTLQYIGSNIETCDDKKRGFYENILSCCVKYGFERLYRLALARRGRIVRKYARKPVEFKSLTFSGRSRKTRIIGYNKRFGSVVNSFVSLSGIGRKSFDIPVRFCKDWHGRMGDYAKKSNDYEYTVTFDERTHQVSVHICKDGERYIPEACGDVVGIDVNCKHNLFSLSDGTSYDYDRKLVRDFCRLSAETDRLKEDRQYSVGKRRQRKFDVLKLKMISSERQLIAGMCKSLSSNGCGHVVMEDLDNGFGRCYVNDSDNSDVNYNRKVGFLGLSGLKQEFEHIARKYGIAVSTVHACYTSKMCPICGCIEDENRPDQETFSCIECGRSCNADFNAAINIRNRVCEAVLRNALLKQLGNGAYEPRNLKREKVKEVLLSYRTSLTRGRESTNTNFS